MCKEIEGGTEWNVLGASRSSMRLDIRVPEGEEGAQSCRESWVA